MKPISLSLMAAAMLAGAAPAQAADTYIFDKTHTNIMWFASHFGFSDSMGQFMAYDGQIILDEEAPEKSSVQVTIDTASVMTGLEKFDAHLKSADFFDVENHPKAVFTSTSIERVGDNSAKVHGTFTLLGKTHPLTLDATLNKLGKNPYNQKQTVGFSVEGVIQRSQYGLTYALPGVLDEVKIRIEAEAILEADSRQP